MTDPKPVRAELDRLFVDLKTLREEIGLQLHLASRDAKVMWTEELEPKLGALEHQAMDAGHAAVEAAQKLAGDLKRSFTAFRDSLSA
jgi:hypothetical protein